MSHDDRGVKIMGDYLSQMPIKEEQFIDLNEYQSMLRKKERERQDLMIRIIGNGNDGRFVPIPSEQSGF